MSLTLRTTSNEEAYAAVVNAAEAIARDVERGNIVGRRQLLEARFDAGLAWVEHPLGLGGLGTDPALQEVVEQILHDHGLLEDADQRASAQSVFGPMLARHGTPDQQAMLLRPLFIESERWCQLFSEPDAGSDLAGVRTRAVRQGDDWVIEGQKVWTTMAHLSDWGLLLARSSPDAPKHQGLTAFLLDMHDPGVEVRPLRQLTGDAEFNEVFLRGVVVPDVNRIGAEGNGWGVIRDTLTNERRSIGHESAKRGSGPIAEVMKAWKEAAGAAAAPRDRVASMWIRAEAARLLAQRVAEIGGVEAPTASPLLTKIAFTTFVQDAYELVVDLKGPRGMLFPDAYQFRMHDQHTLEGHDPLWNFQAARGRTIGGGTTEILRNTIAERLLGLPREQIRE